MTELVYLARNLYTYGGTCKPIVIVIVISSQKQANQKLHQYSLQVGSKIKNLKNVMSYNAKYNTVINRVLEQYSRTYTMTTFWSSYFRISSNEVRDQDFFKQAFRVIFEQCLSVSNIFLVMYAIYRHAVKFSVRSSELFLDVWLIRIYY